MTTIPVQTFAVPGQGVLHIWENMLASDDGEPVEISAFGDRTLHCSNVRPVYPNTTIRLSMEGNNHPALMPWNVIPMDGFSGPEIALFNPSVGSPTLGAGRGNPRYVRPKVLGISGDPINVTLWCVEIDES